MTAALLQARWVLPIASLPIRDGVVAVSNGRIAAVHSRENAPPGSPLDLGDAVLMPGLINAHSHLELAAHHNTLPKAPLWDWFPALSVARRAAGAADREQAALAPAIGRVLAGGTTCIADISRTGASFEALLASPLRKVLFLELISDASQPPRDPDQLREGVERWQRRAAGREEVTVGISPHAFFTVAWDDLRRCAALAGERDLPVTMHVAETPEEMDWLAGRPGRVSEYLASIPGRPVRVMPQGEPLGLLHRAGMTHLRPLLAHCNYLDGSQIADVARCGASVVYCPRAHRYFGHRDHPWRTMRAAGVNVCLGTDSLASNESLSMLDEIRFLRRAAPNVAPAELLDMATRCGARALGFDGELGVLSAGARADLLLLPLDQAYADDPAAAVTDGDAVPSRIWISGIEVPLD